jgi:hypothetical protein
MPDDWTDEELAAAVDAYNEMARMEVTRKPYSKKAVYRALAKRFPRTEKAFEYRMQNISAVLDELGRPWVPGLKPASNVGATVKPKIIALLQRKSKRKPPSLEAEAAYKLKLPAMRDWLIAVSRAGGKVTYGQVMLAFGIDRFSLRHAMDVLGHQADNRDEPIITAVIVSGKSGRCSSGLEAEFGVSDDEAERQELYDFWRATPSEPAVESPNDKLEVKAARFASVEVRPEQAAFRRLVFEACNGRCVISGCDGGTALDAAHLVGRDWRKGQNGAKDGIMLRKDLHALYDAGKLTITSTGAVECHEEYYSEYQGKATNILKNSSIEI